MLMSYENSPEINGMTLVPTSIHSSMCDCVEGTTGTFTVCWCWLSRDLEVLDSISVALVMCSNLGHV